MEEIKSATTPELKTALETLEDWVRYESDMGDKMLDRIDAIKAELKLREEYNGR